MSLDRFDRQLLNLVQDDSARTAERLAARVGLSASAVQRRLKRMRDEGVIVADCAVVDPAAVGRPTFFVVSIHVERERADLVAQLREWLAARDEIQQVYYVTGDADYVLIVSSPDTVSYEALMSRMMQENPNVKRYSTSVALGVLKRGLKVPVPPGDEGPFVE